MEKLGYAKERIAYCLLQTARALQHERLQIRLVGPITHNRDKLAGAPPNVRIVRPVPKAQVHDWYQRVDVYALPTLSDGFALTQIEVMAHGVPVIVTQACGEVVRHEVNGWLVPSGDTEALTEQLRATARNYYPCVMRR